MFEGGGGGHDFGENVFNNKVFVDTLSENESDSLNVESESSESGTVVPGYQENVSEKLDNIELYVVYIFFGILLYFVCHTIHNIFNKFRGVE